MAILRCVFNILWSEGVLDGVFCIACTPYANHPICYAFSKQTAEEAAAFLLGSVSEIRRERETEAGNDSCLVSFEVSILVISHYDSFKSNAIRNDLVSALFLF